MQTNLAGILYIVSGRKKKKSNCIFKEKVKLHTQKEKYRRYSLMCFQDHIRYSLFKKKD